MNKWQEIESVKNSITVLANLDELRWKQFKRRIDDIWYLNIDEVQLCLICEILDLDEVKGLFCECRHSHKDHLEFLLWAINVFESKIRNNYICEPIANEKDARSFEEKLKKVLQEMKCIQTGKQDYIVKTSEGTNYLFAKINKLWTNHLRNHKDLDNLCNSKPLKVYNQWDRLLTAEVFVLLDLIDYYRQFSLVIEIQEL